MKANEHKSAAEIEKIKVSQELANKAIEEKFQERMEAERRESDARIEEMERITAEAIEKGNDFPLKEFLNAATAAISVMLNPLLLIA